MPIKICSLVRFKKCIGLDSVLTLINGILMHLTCFPNLHPNLTLIFFAFSDRLLIQCPSLENVYALGCQELLIEVIQNHIRSEFNQNMALTSICAAGQYASLTYTSLLITSSSTLKLEFAEQTYFIDNVNLAGNLL